MASGGVAIASGAGLFASVPVVGWVAGIAAAYIDATFLYPALTGEGVDAARPPVLQGVPVGSNRAGAERIWAIGADVRVPTHILYQDRKVRESVSSANKGGTATPLRRVNINALVSLNDRETRRLTHLIGNGKLLLYSDRNIIVVRTPEMTATYDASGPHITVAMNSTEDPDFADRFEVDDIVLPAQFVRLAGPTTFNGYWRLLTVAEHVPGTPSFVTMYPADGQTMTSLSYTGGSIYSPAQVARVDDAIVQDCTALYTSGVNSLRLTPIAPAKFRTDVLSVGDRVTVRNMKHLGGGGTPAGTPISLATWHVQDVWTNGGRILLTQPTVGTATGNYVKESADELPAIEYAVPPTFTAGIFPPTYSIYANYASGSETQGENALLVADKGTGNVPAYRGVAYQALDEFYATSFGDQLPFSLEALVQPDAALTWAQAVQLVLERADIPTSAIDTSGMPEKLFAGMFLRGAVPTLTAMQPMLLAGQLLGQERDGTICVFDMDSADVVQVENGAVFSDMATIADGESRKDNKVVVQDASEQDLPTSVGVRHQDPDNSWAEGYQHFGLRNPGGVDHQNEQDVDVGNMVLTRKEARNLASTILRRAWVNRRTYRFTLPAAYLDLLENDICTFTTDEGDVVRCRVIQRDIGADFRVAVTAVNEDVHLAVSGSPVQSGAGLPAVIVVAPASLRVIPIDAPGIRNSEVVTPAVKLAVCANGGGENWAGAVVHESVNGASYQSIGNIGAQAAIAQLDGTLAAQDSSEAYGTTTVTLRAQTVDVTFAYEGDTALEAATQAEAEAGKNWCAIYGSTDGVEIAAFTTVTPLGNGQFTLGGWLRGLRGTLSPDQFLGYQMVMLHPAQDNVFFREFAGALPASLNYKVVPLGLGLDDVAATSITPTFANALPLPIRDVVKTYNATTLMTRFDVAEHWTRQVLPLGTQPPHALDEPFETYRVNIYQSGSTDIIADTYEMDSRFTGSATLRDTYFDWSNARATAAGYTPGPTETYYISYQQVGLYGDGPLRFETI
jgi:hypothetical protein